MTEKLCYPKKQKYTIPSKKNVGVFCCLPSLPEILQAIPLTDISVLDVGIGKGTFGYLLRHYYNATRIVGLEIFEPYIEVCRKHGSYDELLHYDVSVLPLPFKTGEFDLVIASEIVEHLPKETGLKLIAELQRVANMVIVATPAFFSNCHIENNGVIDGNASQIHESIYRAKEFEKLGFNVVGLGRWRVRGKNYRYIGYFLEPWCRWFPNHSSALVAVWRKQK